MHYTALLCTVSVMRFRRTDNYGTHKRHSNTELSTKGRAQNLWETRGRVFSDIMSHLSGVEPRTRGWQARKGRAQFSLRLQTEHLQSKPWAGT